MADRIKFYALNAVDIKSGKVTGCYPEFFPRLTTLAERVQDIQVQGVLGEKNKLVRLDLTSREASERQTELMFGRVKNC